MYTTRNNSVVPAWVMWLFCNSAAVTIISAYSTELFPTAYRASAATALVVANTLGGASGLMLEAVLYGILTSHWSAISWLTLFGMVTPVIIYGFFPETAGRELEATSKVFPHPERSRLRARRNRDVVRPPPTTANVDRSTLDEWNRFP